MANITFFQRFFPKKAVQDQQKLNIEHGLCLYVMSFFTDAHLINGFAQKLEKVEKEPATKPISQYVQLYSALEAMLVKSKLPVVSSTFTTDEIREHLRKKFGPDLLKLEPSFYLIFDTGASQNLLLYGLGLKILCELFTQTVGFPLFQHTVLLHKDERCLKHLQLGEKEVVLRLPTTEEITCSTEEIVSTYSSLYRELYLGLDIDLGKKAAHDVFARLLTTISSYYTPDLVAKFTAVVPKAVFEVPSE